MKMTRRARVKEQLLSTPTLHLLKRRTPVSLMLLALLLVATGAVHAVPSARAITTNQWIPTGALNTARYVQTAALLPTGEVLVAGGFYNPSNGGAVLASAELYHPASGTWSYTGSMTTPRVNGVMAALQDGRVLVAGGSDNLGAHLASAELYDPTTGTWTATGPMSDAHIYATATLLQNGRVLVAGGCCGQTITLNSAELFDPTTGQWSVTGALGGARYAHTATLLPNGNVLVTGGRFQVAGSGSAPSLDTAELYNPATGQWTATGRMLTPRSDHTATLLPNGNVLIAGGEDCTSTTCTSLASAEVYNVQAGTWTTTGSMSTPRYVDTATLLPTGKVLLAGGYSTFGQFSSTATLYDPTTGQWTDDAALTTPRYDHTATLLQNGQVLVAGGNSVGGLTASAELYNTGSGQSTPTATPSPTATGSTVTATSTSLPPTATSTSLPSTATSTPLLPTATSVVPTTTATPAPGGTLSGSWTLFLRIGHVTSLWELTLVQDAQGLLTGRVDNSKTACEGTVMGTVRSGGIVTLSWTLTDPCAGEKVQLNGKASTTGSSISGIAVDSVHGQGVFLTLRHR